jgi:hypothetical protein
MYHFLFVVNDKPEAVLEADRPVGKHAHMDSKKKSLKRDIMQQNHQWQQTNVGNRTESKFFKKVNIEKKFTPARTLLYIFILSDRQQSGVWIANKRR